MVTTQKKKKKEKYAPIVDAPRNWPVVQLSRNSKSFIEEVVKESIGQIKEANSSQQQLLEELETTLFREKMRVKRNPWKVDPPDDAEFWEKIKSKLVAIQSEESTETADELLQTIVERYAGEILSKFKPSRYRVTRSIVKFGFSRLLNASRVDGMKSLWSKEYSLSDKIKVRGHGDHLRKLAKEGTIVMVPTHFSNLDSILIGWIIHILGLPPFIYGAGLNLFNISIIAYFMNSLGAYKVDRRKKNLIYLEVLKAYSNVAIQKGCHSLFFPGGTRSRSGKLEKYLKKGLLTSVIDAQRTIYERTPVGEKTQKVYIVPVALNYHFVLEAPALINDYLKSKGQERYYVENDEFSNSYKILTFLFKFFTKGSDISVSIGRPMDVLGNYVSEEGESLDHQGRVIDTRDYFIRNDAIVQDKQRDEEYTKRLSQVIVDEFHNVAEVFASHLVAFTAFELIKKRYKKLDLYNLLRLSEEEVAIKYDEFRYTFSMLREKVIELHKQGKIGLPENLLNEDIDAVIKMGLKNVGMYHAVRPLTKLKNGDITSKSLSTLYYYHNRLEDYDLEQYV